MCRSKAERDICSRPNAKEQHNLNHLLAIEYDTLDLEMVVPMPRVLDVRYQAMTAIVQSPHRVEWTKRHNREQHPIVKHHNREQHPIVKHHILETY